MKNTIFMMKNKVTRSLLTRNAKENLHTFTAVTEASIDTNWSIGSRISFSPREVDAGARRVFDSSSRWAGTSKGGHLYTTVFVLDRMQGLPYVDMVYFFYDVAPPLFHFPHKLFKNDTFKKPAAIAHCCDCVVVPGEGFYFPLGKVPFLHSPGLFYGHDLDGHSCCCIRLLSRCHSEHADTTNTKYKARIL